MLTVKIQCGCGQRYAFDTEPVNGQMAAPVLCPVCGADGTAAGNEIIARSLAPQPVATPPAPAPTVSAPPPRPRAKLRTAGAEPHSEPAAPATTAGAAVAVVAEAPPEPEIESLALPPAKGPVEFSFGRGILGAVTGALIGAGLMYAFYQWAGFRLPYLGVSIGALSGYGAKLLFRGTDNSLGFIAGGVALVAVVGTLFLMYGTFPIPSIISAVISVSVAYRIASG